MNRQGTRDQGINGTGRVVQLLRQALPPIGDQGESGCDLWPAMQRRLRSEPISGRARLRVPWFDWALAACLAAMLVAFPSWIPVLLYYL
jgi:hypothetical protein